MKKTNKASKQLKAKHVAKAKAHVTHHKASRGPKPPRRALVALHDPAKVSKLEQSPAHLIKSLARAADAFGLSEMALGVSAEPLLDLGMRLMHVLSPSKDELEIIQRPDHLKPLPKCGPTPTDRDNFINGLCRLLDVDFNLVRDYLPFEATAGLLWPVYQQGCTSLHGGTVFGWVCVFRFLERVHLLTGNWALPSLPVTHSLLSDDDHHIEPYPDKPGMGGDRGDPRNKWYNVKDVDKEGRVAAPYAQLFRKSATKEDFAAHRMYVSETNKAFPALVYDPNKSGSFYMDSRKGIKEGNFAPVAAGSAGPIHANAIIHRSESTQYGPGIHVTGHQYVSIVSTPAAGALGPPQSVFEPTLDAADVFLAGTTSPLPLGNINRGALIRLSPDFMNGRMALLCQMFTRWRCRGMTLRYAPSCPTSTIGQLVFGHSSDPCLDFENTTSNSFASITQLGDSRLTQVWAAAELHIPCMTDWLFVERSTGADSDSYRMICCGAAFAASDLSAVSSSVRYGSMWLEYSVEFAGPAPSYGLATAYQLKRIYGVTEYQALMGYLLRNPSLVLKLIKECLPPDDMTPDDALLLGKLHKLGFVEQHVSLLERLNTPPLSAAAPRKEGLLV